MKGVQPGPDLGPGSGSFLYNQRKMGEKRLIIIHHIVQKAREAEDNNRGDHSDTEISVMRSSPRRPRMQGTYVTSIIPSEA